MEYIRRACHTVVFKMCDLADCISKNIPATPEIVFNLLNNLNLVKDAPALDEKILPEALLLIFNLNKQDLPLSNNSLNLLNNLLFFYLNNSENLNSPIGRYILDNTNRSVFRGTELEEKVKPLLQNKDEYTDPTKSICEFYEHTENTLYANGQLKYSEMYIMQIKFMIDQLGIQDFGNVDSNFKYFISRWLISAIDDLLYLKANKTLVNRGTVLVALIELAKIAQSYPQTHTEKFENQFENFLRWVNVPTKAEGFDETFVNLIEKLFNYPNAQACITKLPQELKVKVQALQNMTSCINPLVIKGIFDPRGRFISNGWLDGRLSLVLAETGDD